MNKEENAQEQKITNYQFCEEYIPKPIREEVKIHTTIDGKGVVARIGR